ncbi:Holliday junction branch migration protein RuvA [Rubrobacter taiwanensis]|uniref:Holliday junction branch migration complex subunit RuvA n=1 Tax=Rubrobacter taiwanensis TaxID=185139 RepID=A0A4R1BHK6_9ACTN|nr:Holliday junction branch migration protein RuvA [Rubrobacter taiwanensis]TCJ16719.1 Holliday junction branch migration protein RuvA [Rubrobacter taiwanensis]
MIHRLRGELVEKSGEGAVLDVGGVGYYVATPLSTLRKLPRVGQECVLHTRMVVREDAIQLFGFATREERASFDALTAVSKVGPKLALAVLSALSPAQISEAVGRGDVTKLASVPGLGKKTAERLVLELRGKDFVPFEPQVSGNGAGSAYLEAREALTGLGYSLEEAEQVLRDVPEQDSVQEYVKAALRKIGSER